MKKIEWFSNWFDSPYYHILYKDRDDEEASAFLSNLLNYFAPQKNSFMLDLACGSGRHTNFLAKKGYNVMGVDLSLNSITTAKEKQQKNTRFFTADMRHKIDFIKFDYVLNLFTSFGYFETIEENYQVIEAVKHCLNKDGIYVIDFFNSYKVAKNLVKNEVKTIDDIAFNIEKSILNNFVLKTISFTDKLRNYNFVEKVQLFNKQDFETLLSNVGFQIVDVFGNYNLDQFDEQTSDRLIIMAKLNN